MAETQTDKSKKASSGVVFSLPVDNRPLTSVVMPTLANPVYAEDQPIVRTNVLLRSGTTVSINDYDEEVHGPSVDESDDEYRRRMMSAPDGRAAGLAHPRTTIANLHTFDSTQVAAAQPQQIVPPTISPVAAGLPVITSDEPNPRLINPSPSGVATDAQSLEFRQQQLTAQQQQLDEEKKRLEASKSERANLRSSGTAGTQVKESDKKK